MSWSLNKDKAIKRFLSTYRRERNKKFKELDVEFMKALETEDVNKKSDITSEKNTLRDFPSTITIDSFSTLDELKSLWPTDILELPKYWN